MAQKLGEAAESLGSPVSACLTFPAGFGPVDASTAAAVL